MPTTTPFANLITFSRGSNATVVGPNGLVQWAPSNLLTFSEQFDNAAWGKFLSASVTANTTTAPDGTTTADTLTLASTTNSRIEQTVTVASGQTYTFSVWMRVAAGTLSVRLYGIDTGAGSAFTVNTSWQRFSITQVASSGSRFPAIVTDGTAGSVFIWGAQLELGSAATTYNSTTVKNLANASEAFNGASWSKNNSSVVAGAQANPINGLFNAQKLMENTATNTHQVQQGIPTLVGTPYTASTYVKAAERTWVAVQMQSGTFAYVNLTTGAVGNTSGSPTVSVISAGSGWWRIGVTGTAAAISSTFAIYAASANGTVFYTGDGNSGIYIYGAQLSDSASLDPYVPTPGAAPSSTAYYGPRFDYDPVTLQPRGLLIEEQRTNLTTYSGDPTNAVWAVNAVAKTSTNNSDPSGTSTALLATADGTNTTHYVQQGPAISFTSGTVYTQSIWAKAGTVDRLQFTFGSPAFGGSQYANFYLNGAGSVTASTGGTATISQYTNGWYRLTFTATATATTSIQSIFVIVITSGTDARLPSNTSSGTFYLWGAQLEAGAFATSYIPTVASQVTRNGDAASMTGTNFSTWYNQSEGTFVVDADSAQAGVFNAVFDAQDGTNQERVTQYLGSQTNFVVVDGSVTQASINSGATSANAVAKVASAYRVNDFASSRNGATAGTDTSGTIPTVDRIFLGSRLNAGEHLNGHLRSIAYYPDRLSNTQLQSLTT